MFEECFRDPMPAVSAMTNFVSWVRGYSRILQGKHRAVLCAKPATFDGMFLNHYLVSAGFEYDALPWKHRVMDVASLIVGRTGCDYHDHAKYLPKVEGHNHNALDDARVLAKQVSMILDPAYQFPNTTLHP